jgi:arabinofuranosyltransferase
VRASGRAHPVTLADHGGNLWTQWGELAERTAARGRNSVLWPQPIGPVFVTPSRSGTYVVWPNIGLLGYAAGPDVHVVDGYGLADPIASRLEVQGWGRAGHSRSLPSPWIEARFSPRSSWVGTWTGQAARVLRCPAVQELEQAVSAPLTPGRFVSNVLASPRLTRLSIPAAPAAAARKLC